MVGIAATVRQERAGHPRIAIVAASLDILGGQGIQAVGLAEALRAEGADVKYVPVNPRFPSGLRWVRRWPYLRTIVNEMLYLPSLAGIHGADVVHVFAAAYWSFLLGPAAAITMARALRKRVILNYHSGEAEHHLACWGALVHPWLRMADEIVVPSDYLRAIFERSGYRARVIRNVVETSRFRYRDRSPLRPRLLSTRNLEPHYRVDNTLRAFALLRRRYPEATLTIAGYGTEEARLRRLAEGLRSGGVHFVGRVEPEDVPALYDNADIFVNSSVVDNQPVSILEAFASGLPVVSTGTGDIPSMVRAGEIGLLVPPDGPEEMAGAVAALLDDPDRALRMARRARQAIREYAWSNVRQEWVAAYAGGGG
jgi:glycosyltransferase involved in cell wall biosynthesis